MIRLYAFTYAVGLYSLGGLARPFELETLPLDVGVEEYLEAVETWTEFLGEEYIVKSQVVTETVSQDVDFITLEQVLEDIEEFLTNDRS